MAGPVSWHERGTRQPRPRECSWPSQAARRRLRSGVAPSFVAVGTAIACRAEMALLKRRMWQLGAAGLGRARHSRPRAELRSTRRRQGTNVFPQLLTRVQAPESAGTAPRPPTARLRSAGRGSRRGARGRRSGTGNGARSLARGRPDAHCEASRPRPVPHGARGTECPQPDGGLAVHVGPACGAAAGGDVGSHSPPRLPVPSPGRAPCHLSWLLSPRIRSTSCHPAGGHLPSSLRSHERLNVVAASRDHSAPGRTAAWRSGPPSLSLASAQ